MKTLSKLLFILQVAVVFSVNSNPLSGEYTIGQDGNFKTITSAIRALEENGVAGPVWIMIEGGKYKEKLSISSIKGVSAVNTVTFESKTGNNSDVVIETPSDLSDFVLSINNCSYLTFENITLQNTASQYGNVVRIDGNAEYIRFKGCIFNGVDGARTGANNAVVYSTPNGNKNNLFFDDTEFNYGSYGLYKKSLLSSGNTVISGCLFYNQYEGGIYLENENAPNLSNNVINSLTKYKDFKAVSFEKCQGSSIISNNIINVTNGFSGLYLNDCTGLENNFGNISGNSISVGSNNEVYGIYLSGTTDNQLINNNRIKLTLDAEQSDKQAYYVNKSSGNNINLVNNLFYDINSGGYTIIGNTYKDFFNQLPDKNSSLSVSANGIIIEKVTPVTK